MEEGAGATAGAGWATGGTPAALSDDAASPEALDPEVAGEAASLIGSGAEVAGAMTGEGEACISASGGPAGEAAAALVGWRRWADAAGGTRAAGG